MVKDISVKIIRSNPPGEIKTKWFIGDDLNTMRLAGQIVFKHNEEWLKFWSAVKAGKTEKDMEIVLETEPRKVEVNQEQEQLAKERIAGYQGGGRGSYEGMRKPATAAFKPVEKK